MKNRAINLTRLVAVTVLALALFAPDPALAQQVEKEYTETVSQLRKDGFGGVDRAIVSFEGIISKSPDFLPAYTAVAGAYLLMYEFSKKGEKKWLLTALDRLDSAIAKSETFHEAYFKRALIYFNLDRPDNAVEDLLKAMEVRPGYLDARITYLQYLLSSGKKESAVRFAESSLAFYPGNPAPVKYFGDVFFREGAFAEAADYYRRVVAKVNPAPNTWFALGKTYQNMEKYEDAVKAFQKALEHNPKLAEAHFALGAVYGEMDKPKEAIGSFKAYLKAHPKDLASLNNLALLYEQNGESDMAKLTWLKVKEATRDKIYLERAEQHLYKLLHSSGTAAEPAEESPAPPETEQ